MILYDMLWIMEMVWIMEIVWEGQVGGGKGNRQEWRVQGDRRRGLRSRVG
jgi:hypothetical protein